MEDTALRPLDPRAVTLWRLGRMLRLGTVGLPFWGVAAYGLGSFTTPAVGAVVVIGVVLWSLTLTVFWPPLQYRHFRYAVREQDLLVQQGVLFRRWSSIPHNRIQHVDTRQGPIERLLGLARLNVFTAAGMSADGTIPALSQEDAERLRDDLSRRGGEADDGV